MELPREYGYVVLVLLLYTFLNSWMASKVGRARIKYKVSYPTLYAIESENKDAKLFNCVQRGHQNSLELMPVFFVMLLLGGLRHPLVAAGFGIDYTIARFFYFKGYSSGIPENRLKMLGLRIVPFFGLMSLLGLTICTVSFGVNILGLH
ncbi:microsomal glutathione S-transferase 3-like [Phoenix dactylifera]|uniref:Glutathione S-transferase 3, mitochondrial n=1 Tax=Phoenix dactylifera TaxID=42345 RepID=A0A8B7BLJ8_PHODC|nr:microsomal glutathione S-transferase 3-like [Phoenix dactylifera]